MPTTPSTVVWVNDGDLLAMELIRAFLNNGSNDVFIRLWDNNFVPEHDSVFADFTEAGFPGYAPIAPTFAPAFLNPDMKAEIDSNVLTWVYTGGVGTATVYGWYMSYGPSGSEVLVAWRKYFNPLILTPTSTTDSRTAQLTAVSEL